MSGLRPDLKDPQGVRNHTKHPSILLDVLLPSLKLRNEAEALLLRYSNHSAYNPGRVERIDPNP